jgi:hypothetical protein
VHVTRGLDGGEALVVSGLENLREGMHVRTTDQSLAH